MLDLHATMLHQLGIDHNRLSAQHQGLDVKLTGVEQATADMIRARGGLLSGLRGPCYLQRRQRQDGRNAMEDMPLRNPAMLSGP